MPSALVRAFQPVTKPPPLWIAKVTSTFLTGLPPASVTSTAGAVATGVPTTVA